MNMKYLISKMPKKLLNIFCILKVQKVQGLTHLSFLMAATLFCACSEDEKAEHLQSIQAELVDDIEYSCSGSATEISVDNTGWSLLRAWTIEGTDTTEYVNSIDPATGAYADTFRTEMITYIRHENWVEGWLQQNIEGGKRVSVLEIGGEGFIPTYVTTRQEEDIFAGLVEPEPPAE